MDSPVPMWRPTTGASSTSRAVGSELTRALSHLGRSDPLLSAEDLPLLYELSGTTLVVSSDRPARLAPPFGDFSPQTTWCCTTTQLAGAPLPDGRRFATCLVRVLEDATETTFIDLLAAGVTALVGPEPLIERLVTTMAADAVAFLSPSGSTWMLDSGGGTRSAPGASGLAPLHPEDARRVLAEAHTALPVVVFVPPRTDPESTTALVAMARPGEAAVVTMGATRGARLVVATDGEGANVFFRAGAPAAPAPGPAPVEVAVLGPIETPGIEAFGGRRPKLTELVTYLALHPEGATARKWTAALWPDRRVPPQTVSNRLSEARRLLGFASDGRPRLRRNGERYLLYEVTTDWHRFQALTRPSESLGSWRAALELVRGQPLADLHEGQWALLEGILPEIERAVVLVALRYAGASLNAGEPADATWAANQGLRVCPWSEELHRVLMRAADAAGDRAGVDETLRHLALVLEIDGDPLKGVHPDTAELYRRLFAAHDVEADARR